MSLALPIFLAALGLAPAAPEPGFHRSPQSPSLAMTQDLQNTDALIERLSDPELRVAAGAWVALWTIPRSWTPEQLDAILAWLPDAPPLLESMAAQRLPTVLGLLVLPRTDLDRPAFLPAEIPLVQSLYASASLPLLLSLLSCDPLLREVPIPPSLIQQWTGGPDELSLAALRVASERMDAKSLVALLDAGWDQADAAWKLQSVQLAASGAEYLAWLRPRAAGDGELAQRAQTTLQLHSPDPKERKATVEIIGKSNDPGVMAALLSAMRDPDESVAASALFTFWENPRPYTADVMEGMLHLIPDVSLSLRRTIVENLPLIAGVIGQQRSPLRLAPLSPQDTRIIQALFESDDRRMLRNLLADFNYFSNLTLSDVQLLRWIAMPDEISVKALSLAPRWVEPPALLAALEERWKTADDAWKLQAVQMPWADGQYLAWLDRHEEPGEVGEMARLTALMYSGISPAKLADVRHQLTTPAALHRWAQMLPALGKAGSGQALAELVPDGLLTPDLVQNWGAFGTAIPPEIAAPLLDDRRMTVRAFAEQSIQGAAPDQAQGWCGSEFYDVRVLGARLAPRAAVEDLLIDDRPEVRLAAVVRWANENWPDLDKTLRYGLADPLLTDNLLLATVNLPQCQAILSAWGASEPQRSKLNSAKSIPHRLFPLPLPAR
jgi:hypothetical protein